MHKLMDYICEELEQLEKKADKDGKLSMSEVEYADKLLHMKKNLLKAEELYEDSEYSMADGMSYARGGRGGSRRGGNQYGSYASEGRGGSYRQGGGSYASGGGSNAREGYSRATEDITERLHDLMSDAPDERTRQEIQKMIRKMETM